ncbi:MAG: histidine phosphatase family protein [Planctomycetaceae bacterium]|jgi:2,3-bisphosphoglycerate-dependent phosphoglycerate mutase|nr:histidine phosphatase family protein [Planctomycetaceae bacterium]
MQLYLVRHAESENNARPIELRVEDPSITDLGHRQAQHLSEWMESLTIDTLITSPVRRALQTTRYIAQATGSHVHVWADIFEEGGIYRGHGPTAVEGGPGLTRQDVIEHVVDSGDHCTLDDSITQEGWWGRDRETPDQAELRSRNVKQRLINTFGSNGNSVVAVIHADLKRRLLIQLLGDPAEAIGLGHLRNTGVTKLVYNGLDWTLDWFNSISHLPNDLITNNLQP